MPPLFGSEQVIFLYFKLSGENPPFEQWVAADKTRTREQFEELYKITADRTDLARFHRDLELALYNYSAETQKQPLGTEKATFITSPIADSTGLEIHVKNPGDFEGWEMTPDEFEEMHEKNDNNVRYKFVSVMKVLGTNLTKPEKPENKRVLDVYLEDLDIYTKDGKTLIKSFKATD